MATATVPARAAGGTGSTGSTGSTWRIAACVLVGTQVFVSELDFEKVGIPEDGVVDLARRVLLQAPLYILPLALLCLRSPLVARIARRPPMRLALVWLVWGIATTIWSRTPQETAQVSLSLLGLWLTATWFVLRHGLPLFMRVYIAGSGLFLVGGLLRDLASSGEEGVVRRFSGLSFEPTNLGRLALLTAVVAAVHLLQHDRRDRLARVVLPLAIVVTVATGTRTSLIAAVVCALLLTYRRAGLARALLAGAVVVGVAVVTVSSIPDPAEFVSRSQGEESIATFNGRDSIWRNAWELATERPIVGHGVSSGAVLFPLEASRGDLQVDVGHAHNILLELAMTEGAIGVLLFLAAIASYAARRRGPRDLTSVIVVAFLVSGSTEAIVNRPSAALMVLAAAFTHRALDRRSGRSDGAAAASIGAGDHDERGDADGGGDGHQRRADAGLQRTGTGHPDR